MGLDVFGRIKDIVSANVDELLSRAEDPERMADQMVRKYEDAIKDLLGSTASVMASAKEAKAKLEACDADIRKFETYAKRAVADGNDDKARDAIRLKQEKEALRPALEQSYLTVKEQADKAESDYHKLTAGLENVKARAEAMKNTVKTAKIKDLTGEVQAKSTGAVTGVMSRFDKLESKANRMLNEAAAKEALVGKGSREAELETLYGGQTENSVEAELEAIKKAMQS